MSMVSGKSARAFALTGALNSLSALAASAPHCVGDDSKICFSWGVPDDAIQSGSGNVYFQLSAPKTYEWAALGIGSQMKGAEIFLMYQDGAGNVTLSPRAGVGHVMPKYTERDVELLAGSGVVDDNMVANVRCGDCQKLDLKGSGSWISAWKTGDAINSKDTSAQIQYHDDHSIFDVDLSKASITSDSNPFTEGSQSGNNNNGGNTGNNNGSGGDSVVSPGSGSSNKVSNMFRSAHGILMMIVWVILYPVGALLMPIVGKWFFHAAFQTIAFLAMWAGFGMGVFMSRREGYFWGGTHTRLGLMACALMGLQPFLGALHHVVYKRQGRRGALSHVHVWFGRSLIILGVVNGGFGLKLASASRSLYIAYIVLAAIFAGGYIVGVPYIEYRKMKQAKEAASSKTHGSTADSDENSAAKA